MSSTESSDMQLLEISRRARKLARMINSLFKVQNFDGRSKRVPSTGVLVEDALSMTTADAKEEEKLEMGRKIGADQEGEQFGSCSWRSCCHEEEEVKKVIRESLLLSSRDDEKASSSRSLRSYIRSGEFSSSFREEEEEAIKIKKSRRPQGKMTTPNLIARLMGLEELPARETAAAAAKIKPERESPSVSRDGAPERVTLLSIIEREKAAKRDGCGFSMQIPTWGREEEEQEPLNSSSRLKPKKKKDNIEHQPLPQAKKSSMNYSVTNPGNKAIATGVKPAQKIAKLETSIEKVEETSKGEDDASVMDISPAPEEPAQNNQNSSRSSNNEHSAKDLKINCQIRPKPSQLRASRCPSDSINNRLDDANKRVAGEVKHLDACQLSTIYEATSTNDSDAEANLYLGSARELLLHRRRRYQELQAHHPRLATGSSGRELAGEICKGIRKLIGKYSVVIGHEHGSERDQDVALNAVWDDGWRHGLGWEAAAEVVGQLEEMVVTELMEEVAWPWMVL